MSRLASLLLPLLVLSGCAVSAAPSDGVSRDDLSQGSSDKSSSKKKKSSDDEDTTAKTTDSTTATTDEAVDQPAAPAAGPEITYVGTLAETEPVGFGGVTADGQQVCAVQVWKNISITVIANEKGQVKSFELSGTNVEEANPACAGVTVAPESIHSYSYTSDAPSDVPAKLIAAPANLPQADLVADVAVHAEAGGRATINFRSSDGGANAWRYTKQFPLTKK